ncbi:MAG: hypothetical protein ACJ79T_14395 [Myxococcales bacterium]
MRTDEVERLDHRLAFAEVDPDGMSEIELVLGIGDVEVGEEQAVLVVVDASVAGEPHASALDRGVDAQMRHRPRQLDVDPGLGKADLPELELTCADQQAACRSFQVAAQVSVDGDAAPRELSVLAEARHAKMHFRVGLPGRPRHARDQMRRARERYGPLLLERADGLADGGQIRRVHDEIHRHRVARRCAVGGEAQPERRGGEGADEGLAALHVGGEIGGDVAHPLEPRRSELHLRVQVAVDSVLVETRDPLAAAFHAARHLAVRTGPGDRRRIHSLEL